MIVVCGGERFSHKFSTRSRNSSHGSWPYSSVEVEEPAVEEEEVDELELCERTEQTLAVLCGLVDIRVSGEGCSGTTSFKAMVAGVQADRSSNSGC